MKKIKLISLFATICLLFTQSIYAEIKLPAIVSSNMVLQRNTTIVIWGWADPKEKITIETSWSDKQINIQADKDGYWRTELKTTNDKKSQKIPLYKWY